MTDSDSPLPSAKNRLPAWLKRSHAPSASHHTVEKVLSESRLHTVCKEAKCPNRSECFGRGTATFLILGDHCTRSCGFCGISHTEPLPVDSGEPLRVAETAFRLKLRHVVVTSVTRDDLPDGGSAHFAQTIIEIRRLVPDATIEVLVPDFCNNTGSLDTVLRQNPAVFNHNLETVPRLYASVRPQAIYARSLDVLSYAAQTIHSGIVKSGIMLGLGETTDEVHALMRDCVAAGCLVLTIGQYLQPSPLQLPVIRFVPPEEFGSYAEFGRSIGFKDVVSGPFVRSSYHAERVLGKQNPR